MRRSVVLTASLLLTAAVAAGCGSDAPSNDQTMSDRGGSSSTAATGSPSSSDSSGSSGSSDEAASAHGGAGHHGEPSPVAPGARRIEVAATSMSFDPAEIRVQTGEDIAIALTSDDVLHDLTIDELHAHIPADAGETVVGGFHAAEPGRYTFYCSVEGHREGGMEGTLVVE